MTGSLFFVSQRFLDRAPVVVAPLGALWLGSGPHPLTVVYEEYVRALLKLPLSLAVTVSRGGLN